MEGSGQSHLGEVRDGRSLRVVRLLGSSEFFLFGSN